MLLKFITLKEHFFSKQSRKIKVEDKFETEIAASNNFFFLTPFFNIKCVYAHACKCTHIIGIIYCTVGNYQLVQTLVQNLVSHLFL